MAAFETQYYPEYYNILDIIHERLIIPQQHDVHVRDFIRDKSIKLFLSNLSDKQRNEYDKYRAITAVGNDTGTKYTINCASVAVMYNISYNQEFNRHRICFRPKDDLPLYDIFLAQKIALECFENETLKVANKGTTYDYIPRQRYRPSFYE